MVKFRKAFALIHYALIIAIVTLGLVTMRTYLRRGIQAKIKDLTDHIISDRQLATLSDSDTEISTKNTQSTTNLIERKGAGGAGSLSIISTSATNFEHEVENLDTIDYGKGVTSVSTPSGIYSGYGDNQPSGGGPSAGSGSGRGSGGGALFYGSQGSE